MAKSAIQKALLAALLCGVMAAAGCSAAQPPTGALSRARFAVRGAEMTQASQYAPVELRSARDKLDEAEKAMRTEDYVKARRLAEQALVDARLADAKAESEIARQNAADLQKTVKTLRAETERESSR